MEYAYHQEDLEAYLVSKEKSYPGICNLDNDINPIWRRENFRMGNMAKQVSFLKENEDWWDRTTQSLDPKIYERIEPALRLASLLLEQSGPFFSHVLHGILQPRQVRRLHPVGATDEWKIRRVDVIGTTLTYIPIHDDSDEGDWGETQTTLKERCRYAVGIGSALAKVLCRPHWNETPAQIRRYYNFQLATTLLHELAHIAWICRRWDHYLKHPNSVHRGKEAIVSRDEEQMELGQSWENWFFGCQLRLIERDDASPPTCLGFACAPFTRDTANPESIQHRDSRYGSTAVTVRSINRFFQKERWAAHIKGDEPLSIELTPLNSLSGKDWKDGDLDASFMNRMTINHENRVGPVPSFPDATPQTRAPKPTSDGNA